METYLYINIIILSLGVQCWGGEHEYRLTKYLLSNYEESVRPVENSSLPLIVEFGVSLHQIVDVDEKNQILTTNCWLTQVWNDTHLTWNYSDFDGIKAIRLPYTKVWRPDIILYNNADSQYNTATINTNVIVSYTGEVVWLSHGMFKSSCEVSVEYFPFDIQDCQMKWASWTYDGYSLDLRDQNINSSGDMSNYQVNGEFVLEDFSSDYHMKHYSCCEEPYPDITYTIRIRRRPLFYVFNLILPCVLINGIALLVFYVPSESGEKVTLGISALLSMTVFLMTIRESLPPTEKTPLITLYYGVSICLVSFASAMAVVTLNIHYRGLRGAEVPEQIKSIFLGFFARIVFVLPTSDFAKRKKDAAKRKELNASFQGGGGDNDKLEPGIFNRSQSPIFSSATANGRPYHPNHMNSSQQQPGNGSGQQHNGQQSLNHIHPNNLHTCDLLSDPNVDGSDPRYQLVLDKVSSTIDRNEVRYLETDMKEQHALEWKQVALVIDRLLLLVFFLAMTISSLVILTSSPHLK
ncbi:neuronal acetylcholine receptor subunit alpha-10 isoform X2 [Eurytemora carolleeae]|uniref:neuronal acetylcholine receptor subunit alpha-10 isoform X1 n=1 Tax=Eurytemora carolleeae TaxID=1294199 RepID=UPI000C75A347|nr:neuronal acetylcholine receptor subunit alpha-10 isoform X1 [Eurytemora carolleeae]XP_023342573.1 neuronal acetylcholine receptor subunit alpha-10 isoform X2 [Eurytemora carolleeae]|eukprot:XP_023342572.1 neuronal acetylcholine receptor subunit alpha-10-like isoform X1 [Eurytemora affinis]